MTDINIIILNKNCAQLLHRQKEDDLRVAVEDWFKVLKRFANVFPSYAKLAGPDKRPISELTEPPESWVEWFRKDCLVVSFEATTGAEALSFAAGKPDEIPETLKIWGPRDVMDDADQLRGILEKSIPIWNADEGDVTLWKDGARAPWLHWLKHDQEPTGYVRYPMPDGWSTKTELLDGMLYEWPENRP